MLVQILRRIGASLITLACLTFLLTSPTFAASPAKKASSTFHFQLIHTKEPKNTSSASVDFHYHLLHAGISVHASIVPSKVVPNDPPEDNCLGVSLTVTNPYPEEIRVIMGVSNLCGAAVSGVSWSYSTTDICNGQTYGGPNNSGSIGLMVNRSFRNIADDWWEGNCISDVSGAYTDFESSTTGSAEGTVYGEYAYGLTTTGEQTFY